MDPVGSTRTMKDFLKTTLGLALFLGLVTLGGHALDGWLMQADGGIATLSSTRMTPEDVADSPVAEVAASR